MRKRINFKQAKNNPLKKVNHFARNKQIKITQVDTQKIEVPNNKEPKTELNHPKNTLANFIRAISFGFLLPKKDKEYQIKNFLNNVINDFNSSFEKIKKIYERERN